MPHVCPRPCSRLATALVFISVGVVQLIAGIILLRSKYAYLLAGPDFWTSFCNIAVGCLLGVTASVWKQSKKKKSKKYIIRRNVLLALLFSALALNSTTLGILLLSSSNALLSIRLENSEGHSNSAFDSEVLAVAYATSVCSPIVCLVVGIVAMPGGCFISSVRKNSIELKTSQNNLKKDRSASFQWVYATPDQLNLPIKKKSPEVIHTSSDSSSDDETSEEAPIHQKCATSVEDLQHVMRRMAQGERDSIVGDSAVMLRALDLRRKNKYNSVNKDGSYVGPSLRTEESASRERKYTDSLNSDSPPGVKNAKFYRHSLAFDRNAPLLDDAPLERVSHLRNDRQRHSVALDGSNRLFNDVPLENISRLRNDRHRHSVALNGSNRLLDDVILDRMRHLKNEHRHYMVLDGNVRLLDDVILERMRRVQEEHRHSKVLDGARLLDDVTLELMRRHRNEQHLDSMALGGNTCVDDVTLKQFNRLRNELNTSYRILNPADEVFNEDQNALSHMAVKCVLSQGRNFHENLPVDFEVNDVRLGCNSERIDKCKDVPTVHKSAKMANMDIKTEDSTPDHSNFKGKRELSPDDQGTISEEDILKCNETSRHGENLSPVQNDCFSPEGSDFGADSFDLSRTNSLIGETVPINVQTATIVRLSKKLIPVQSPVVPTNPKKYDLVKSSGSIMEPPCTKETDHNSAKEKVTLSSFKGNLNPGNKDNLLEYPKVGSPSTKKYDLTQVVKMTSISEEPNAEASQFHANTNLRMSCQENGAIPKLPESRPNKSSVYCESLTKNYEDREIAATETTPKRKRSVSGTVLRKMWSRSGSAGSEKEMGFLDQVVDGDSLIGLTEEELIARQIRNRSIRKAIQQRIKKEEIVV